MGNCCRSVASKSSDSQLNVVLLGLDAAGKTELVSLLQRTERIDFAPTVGCRSQLIRLAGLPELRITELGGARDVRDIWHHYYPEAHAGIFVVDSADRRRLPEAQQVLGELMLRTQLSGKPMLVVCAKQDLPDALDVLDCSAELDAERLANRSRTPCFVASLGAGAGDDGEGVDLSDVEAGLRWLVQRVQRDWRRIRNQNAFFSMDEERRPELRSSRSVTPSRRRRRETTTQTKQKVQSESPERAKVSLGRPKSAPAARDKRSKRRIAPSIGEPNVRGASDSLAQNLDSTKIS